MEQLKKMVPVVAVGLAVAAMSSVDAYAAEEPAQPVDAAPPAEEVKQEAPAPSTEINTAVAVQTPEVSEPPETSETPDTPGTSDPVTTPEETPGQTTTELVVNPGTDAEGGGKGTLTNTTTPGETEVTETTGDPTTTVTTNPDGSTTTTTTTPTETTTTETSSSEITGTVTDRGEPSEGEIDKVQDSWAQLIQGLTPTEGPDGSQVYTIEQSKEEGKALTVDELAAVLGVTLDQVEGEDNTYTYTSQDGKTVTTVTVTSDASTETTTTRWTITVKENSEEKTGSYEIPVKPVTDFISDQNVKDILNQANQPESGFKEVVKDEKGYITKVVDGTKTYEFAYKPVKVEDMTVAEIYALLPEDLKDRYEVTGDTICDKDGHALNLDRSQLVHKIVTITMTVTDSHGSQSGPHYDEVDKLKAEQNATSKAMTNAVIEALQADAKITKEAAEDAVITVTRNADGSWTATVTIDQRSYSYIVSANKVNEKEVEWIAQQDTDKEPASGEEVASRFTTFVSNTAYISGSTVVWSDTIDGKFPLTDDGKIDIKVEDILPGLAKVVSVTPNNDGSTTVVAKNATGVTYTYTFTYGKPGEDEIAALRAKLEASGENLEYNLDDLIKTTWTVTVTSDLTVFNQTITLEKDSLKGNIEKVGSVYHYTLEDGSIIPLLPTDEAGIYKSDIYGDKLYVLRETKANPETVNENVIQQLLDSNRISLPAGYHFDKVDGETAIYTNDAGGTITVYFGNVANAVSVDVLDSKDFSAASKGELEAEIIAWIIERDQVGEDAARDIFRELTITETTTTETVMEYDRKAEGLVDYFAKGDNDVLYRTLTARQDKLGPGYRTYTSPHVDVSAEVVLEKGTHPVATGYLLPGFEVSLYRTAQELVDNISFGDIDAYVAPVVDKEGKLVYQSDRDRDVSFLAEDNFYKITGTIAYDFLYEFDTIKNVAVSFSSKDLAKEYIDKNHLDYVAVQNPDNDLWYLCKTVNFTVCDYISGSFCEEGGRDINLGKLMLTETAHEAERPVTTYSTTVFTKPTSLGKVVTSTLTLDKINTTVNDDGGSDISGSYQVTETKDENSFKREDGGWLYEGMGSESYNGYRVWEESKTDQTFQDDQYSGKLDYSYVENTTDVKVDASVEKDRKVDVKLDQTSVTTVTGETSTSTTTPAPSNPGGSSGSSGSGSSSRPSSRPSNPSTPENPSVNIPEEDVPLTNLPNEDVPLSDRPEETPTEQPPVTELPEEDVPLAETPVQARAVSAANTTRISDAQTPLADVPETGDPMLMEAFAAAAAGANALWFSMGKKRRDDAE